ncbi:hypothetical protein G3M48_006242 [Beauveria asiatica]|uniref:MADS-box domain-containing protein n=1 Tax=Beauveria asiatica TaxID=1069075 RepID=A0AAW0RQK2_9HYPO
MPRRPRSRVNRDPIIGSANRQRGICKKAHTFAEDYKVDIVVAIRRPDGRVEGYQSKPGLAQQLLRVAECHLIGPTEVKVHGSKNAARNTRSATDSSSPTDSSACSSSYETTSLDDWRGVNPFTPSLLLPTATDQANIHAGTVHDETYGVCLADILQVDSGSKEDQGLSMAQPTPVSVNKRDAILDLLESYL